MVNKILESIYTRKYISEHSLCGLAPRLSKAQKAANVQQGTPPTPTKPGFPNKDVTAVTRKCYKLLFSQKTILDFDFALLVYMIKAWSTFHK